MVISVLYFKLTILPKKLFYEKKRTLRYIHPHTLYVGFTVRVGVKIT